VLEYSTDGGMTFAVAGTYDTATYYNWTAITLPIPVAAQSLATQFRWRQLSNSGTGYDHWALDNVTVETEPIPSILAQPASQTVPVGSNATFTVLAGGATPLDYQWQCNGKDIPGATDASLTLTNLQVADSGNYRVVVTNAFSSIISSVATLAVLAPLGQAVNAPGLVWSTSGNAPWVSESSVSHDGLGAAQSGPIADSQSSSSQTMVTGPGTLTFWWKVSSEAWFDYLTFYLDDLNEAAISGQVDWQQESFAVGSGNHTLTWTYAKDPSVSAGLDAAWLDQVIFITNPPAITLQPLSQKGTMGAVMVLSAAASGAPPITYQWLKNGTNLNGATSTNYVIAKATRRDSGVYQIVASNPGGSTPSSNAILAVRSPQKLGLPLPLPGGTITLTSKDADGGPLLPGDLPGFQAQATTNLMDWATLLNRLTVSNGLLLLVDPDSTNYSRRFYRILEP
jgi:Reelin subrepeat B/Immunoglobulin domain